MSSPLSATGEERSASEAKPGESTERAKALRLSSLMFPQLSHYPFQFFYLFLNKNSKFVREQDMKLLIDIADNKAAGFIELMKSYSYVKAKTISPPDAELFEEIKEIKKAFKNAERIKSGKLKSRPAAEFLNEL